MTGLPLVVLFDAYPHLLGGGQRTLLAVAGELARRGAPPTIVVPAAGPLEEEAVRLGLAVELVALPGALGHYGRTTTGGRRIAAAASLPIAWQRLGAAIRAVEPAVVHVNDHRGMLLAGPAARIAGRPVVWHLHSTDVAGGIVERTAGRLASAIVGPSMASFDGLTGALAHIPTTVVRPPLEDRIRRLAPARPGGAGTLVTAARLHPAKGLDTALRALALLAAQGRAVHLDVFGAAQRGAEAHAAELHRLAADLGIADQVTFHGHVESPQERWLEADLYIQPSRAETFGMGVAEAMSLGLPVVAARVGGLPELVDDGVTGLLVPSDDPDALGRAISDLLDDPARASEMGRAGRVATAGLSAGRAVDDLVEVWDRARRG